jgi:quercetin dioxygenase-like cupin family protein
MPEAVRTAPREDRVLMEPAIEFFINDEVNPVKQEPEWISGSRNSPLVNTVNLSIVPTVLHKNATLCGHEVEGPITLQVLSSSINFGVSGQPRTLEQGKVITLDKGIPHDIQALEDSEFWLTVVK